MHVTVRLYRAVQAATILSLTGVLAIQSPVSSAQHNAAEFFHTREQLAYFEVYHIPHQGVLYRTAISLETLLAKKNADYVRIDSGNGEAVADLYQALTNTVTDSNAECSSDYVDARWAIVLNYNDQTREAIGFGPAYSCVRILSRKAPLVASDALLQYVMRNFLFMH
jgi:hypothetical protein